MGIFDDLNKIKIQKCHNSILPLTLLTSLVVATSGMSPTNLKDSSTPSLSDSNLIDQSHQPARIPFCDDNFERTIGRRLLYVTTLDGRLTALDIIKNGKLRWSIPTGPGALISSSIHRLELTNNGQFVRMIPSLSGGIYKFDGESIDPIPITTEHLLSSSAKFSDDLVISGGKETRTYGVSARTGQLLYECSMNGCINSTETDATTAPDHLTKPSTDDDIENDDNDDPNNFLMADHDPLTDDVIVVRRQTQTVRAIESRTGIERWNFSVGQHELDLLKPNDCHDRKLTDFDMALLDIEIKVIVPEGIVCAFSKSQNGLMLWKYQFDHPVVSAWKIGAEDCLETIDLFGSAAQWLWNSDENIFDMPNPNISPSIYLGMYEKQLYIQESVRLRKEILDQSSLYNQLSTVEPHMPKIPWRPIAASSNSLIIFQEDRAIESGTIPSSSNNRFVQGKELVPYDEDNFALSAQSVLNASEYVNGNGFYLYTDDDLNKNETDSLCDETEKPIKDNANDSDSEVLNITRRTIDEDLGFSLDDIDAPIKVVILSLWFWWKEIVLIAFTSAILLNFLMGQRPRTEREIVVIERHIPVPTGIEATEASTNAILGPITNGSNGNKSSSNGLMKPQRSLSESTSNSGEYFSSRFQSDFDLLRCLGRGGFGVVFEAKNKLDDCKYAIKRITLPNKEESRKRVLREARTLASCEHQNIVRYFHSWVETPPPGWQEQEDNKWVALEMSTSIQIETPDGTTLPSIPSSHDSPHRNQFNGKHIYNDKKKQMLSWISSLATSTACSSDHESDNNNDDDEDDDDSCIIFRSESQSMALKANGHNEYNDDDDEDDYYDTQNKEKKNINNNNNNKSLPDAISIDIHSNSFDLNLNTNGKPTDYTHLSDSFQIEFVRSADGYTNDSESPEAEKDYQLSHRKVKDLKNSNKRPTTLEILTNNNNNYNQNVSKDIIGINGTPPSATLTPPKPNKVYLYIQMQLCRKESLRDWLRDNKTDARLCHIASIFHQIVDAVDYVHFKGLIHRDLKPSNIFFSQEGQVKIGDFGLVTDMSDIPNLVTKCGDKSGLPSCARHTQQVGTHLYMSPEQLRGQPYNYKVDIYSLGLIFFELHVYFGTEMERIKTMRDLRDGKYPEQFCNEYPAEHKLLQRMLANNPEERPKIKELKQHLNQILKIPEFISDNEALAAAARRLSRSRTFSSCE